MGGLASFVSCCACCVTRHSGCAATPAAIVRSVRYAAPAAGHMRLLSRLTVPFALPVQLEVYSLPSCGASVPVACPARPAALLSLPVPASHPCPQLRYCYRSDQARHAAESLALVECLAEAGYRPTVYPQASALWHANWLAICCP